MNYQTIYDNLIQKRVSEMPTGYTETHHILPKCLGGDDSKENLVKLTAREHFIAHLLLTKCYEVGTLEYYKMVHAFFMMLNAKSDNQERLITSKKYEQLKTDFAHQMSKSQTGANNSQYGKVWVHNVLLRESKKVYSTDIPEGWLRGRIVDWNLHYTTRECLVCNSVGCMSKDSKFCSKECKRKYYTEHKKPDSHKGFMKRVSIDDVMYDSITDASVKLSMSHESVRYRLNSDKYSTWFML